MNGSPLKIGSVFLLFGGLAILPAWVCGRVAQPTALASAATDDPELLTTQPPGTTKPTTQPTADTQPAAAPTVARQGVPADPVALLTKPQQEMWAVSQRYEADKGNLGRFYGVVFSPVRYSRMRLLDTDWLAALDKLKSDTFSAEGKAEHAKLKEQIQNDIRQLDSAAAAQAQLVPLLPFAPIIANLEESRGRLEAMNPQNAAGALDSLKRQVEQVRKAIAANTVGKVDKAQAARAAETINGLRGSLRRWDTFYNDYDPMFTWWTTQSFKDADQALAEYATFLKEKVPATAEAEKADAPVPLTAAPEAPVVAAPASGAESRQVAVKLEGKEPDVPDLNELVVAPQSEMRGILDAYSGRGGRGGRGGGGGGGGGGAGGGGGRGGAGPARGVQYYNDWLAALNKLPFDTFTKDGKIEYILLRNRIETDIKRLDLRNNPPAVTILKDDSGIPGRPVGREGIMVDLADEMVPYTPEELINIAEKEYVWCEAEMKKASREMGFGDDWKKAVEKVKTMYVPPGKQPDLIRDLALQATEYVQDNDLVTVPEVARESWQSTMMTPQRQLVNPFFTGGETISISYPTSTMSFESKLESMRGNNVAFSHATVFHELIPGHHLQGFMSARYRTYRRMFGTPFWVEGWSLYWEMLLYERGFNNTPELRVGALFWRMHRCARIVFSLSFHEGKWSPKQCVDYLVDKVGHERENAAGEVRRSFGGSYSPLYQAAYMLGGLQIRELHRNLVGPGKMTERAFHDSLLKENSIPIAMMRADLLNQPLTRDYKPDWKFYGENP